MPDADATVAPPLERCARCDSPVVPPARFCAGCGASLTDVGTVRRDEQQDDAPQVTQEDPTTVVQPVADPVASPSDVAGQSCGSCGWSNPPERELCRRCGADLETGVVPPRPLPAPADLDEIGFAPHIDERRRRWPAVIALVGVVGAVVAVLALAGIGPFAPAQSLPATSFDPAAYAEVDPGPAPLTEIATRTTASAEAGRTFTASQMVDDDPTTAWRSDAADLPEETQETIDLFLAEPAWVAQVLVHNGDQLDADSYERSGRVQRARLTFDGGEVLAVNMLDVGVEPQLIELPEPMLTTELRIEIEDIFPGSAGTAVALSGLALHGWAAAGDDVTIAETRASMAPATERVPETSPLSARLGRALPSLGWTGQP